MAERVTISRHRPVYVDRRSHERQKRAVSSASCWASSGVTSRGVPPIDSKTTPPISPSRSVRVHRTPSPSPWGVMNRVPRIAPPDGVGEVHDFMPITGGGATDRHDLVRNIRVVRGTMRFAIEIQPRFDYGRATHKLEIAEDGGVFQADGMALTAHAIAPHGVSVQDLGITLERDGDGVRWTRTLREGQAGGVVLEWMGGAPRRVTPEEAQRLADETARFWRSWLGRSTYTGRWREQVTRSAMTLKLMTYEPTGGIVAAPTTGLPEQEGGERNWDYRYTWVRDGSF